MKALRQTARFEKQAKALRKKKYDLDELKKVLLYLLDDNPLPGRYRDHALSGNWKGFRECHIKADWLLIYEVTDSEIIFVATGTHDDLF